MKKKQRIVRDTEKWWRMDGETELEKRLNSYITAQFIWRRGAPSDEGLYAAKHVIALVKKYGAKG